MEVINVVMLVLCGSTLTFWGAQGADEDARNSILVMITGAHATLSTIMGIVIPVDGVTVGVTALAIWILSSLMRDDTHKSRLEAATWVGYIWVFMVARTVPMEWVVWTVVPICSMYAAIQVWKRGRNEKPVWSEYAGNSNHNAAFLLMGVVVGLWMMEHISMWSWPLVVIMAIAVVVSRCIGGVIALLLMLSFVLRGMELVVIVLLAIGVFGVSKRLRVESTAISRILLYWAAIKMVMKKPMYGYGLNMYRKELPDVYAKMVSKGRAKWLNGLIGGTENNTSHRVHNDHLETMVELGIVGYGIMVWAVTQMPHNVHTVSLLIAIGVSGMFFFPLREPHTAAPFWIVLGGMVGGKAVKIGLPIIVEIVMVMILLSTIWMASKKLVALCYLNVAEREKNWDKKKGLLEMALKLDPYNAIILSQNIQMTYPSNMDKAMEYAVRSVERFDGEITKWGAWRQLASVMSGMGGSKRMEEWALNRARISNP